MGNELYPTISLEELVSIHDKERKPVTKSDRKPGCFPYYGASGITDYVENYIFDGDYVLLAEDGDNLRTRNTPIAFMARGKFWVNNHAHIIKAKDGGSSDYICYALQVADITSYISGSTRPKITQADMRKIPVSAPPVKVRSSIAKILGSLDQKIELNRETNQTLEQMAQALFKSWFVDFDPVIDNALAAGNPIPESLQAQAQRRQQQLAKPDHQPLPEDIRQLFPNEFEETETLGWVPKGWNITSLKDLISVKHGYAFKGEFFCDQPTGHVLLTPGNVKVGGGFKGDKLKNYNGPVFNDYVFEKGDMYITMTDLSKAGDTLGYPAFVPNNEEITFHHNQRLGKVTFNDLDNIGPNFIYRCLCSKEYRNHIIATATGTTVKHTSPTKILMYKVVHSGGIIESIFEKIIEKNHSKIESNNSVTITITNLRDTLLPKLISGELRLPEAMLDSETNPLMDEVS